MTNIVGATRLAKLKSKQHRAIIVQYAVMMTDTDTAMPTYNVGDILIRVQGDPSNEITAVLVNRYFIPGDETMNQDVYQCKLTIYGTMGEMIGKIEQPVKYNILFGTSYLPVNPQIAVVIDGVWQVDPVQQGNQHNFNFAWIYP